MNRNLILSGSASIHLAQNIADILKWPLKNHRIVHFINSEMKVTLPSEIEQFSHCIIVQSTSNPANDNLVEICLIADTLKREGVKKVEVIVPYFGYARQDRQHLPKECVSIEVIAKILQVVGVEKVYTVDIHNDEVLDRINLEIENLSAMPLMAKKIYQDLDLDESTETDFTIASPDDGGIGRAELFAWHFYKDPKNIELVSIKKERHLDKQHYCEAVELVGEIKDKKVILIDDVSTSGGTILNSLELCKANGVKDLYAAIVHPDFAKGVSEKFQNSSLKKIYTTNSIEKTVENLNFYDKIKVIDIAELFTQSLLYKN